jgi:hypothetical protein
MGKRGCVWKAATSMLEISVDSIFPEMAHRCNVEKHLLVIDHDEQITVYIQMLESVKRELEESIAC